MYLKKSIFFSLAILASCQFAFSQSMESDYSTSAGAKVYFGDGTAGGINVKHFFNPEGAVEGALIFFEGSVMGLDALYEFHGAITDAPGLNWYAGGGGLLLFSTSNEYTNNTAFALHPIMGIDYKFNGAPINVALDANPIFTITPETDFEFVIGLAFRFAF